MNANPFFLMLLFAAVLFYVVPLYGQTHEEGWTRIGVASFSGGALAIGMRENWDSLNVSAANSILMHWMGNKANCDVNHGNSSS